MRAGRHILVVAAVVFVGLIAACGEDGVETTEAPGFSGEEASIDRSPFEMAGPSGDRSGVPTTMAGPGPTLPLPENLAGLVRPGDGDSDDTSPTTTPTTSTTIPTAVSLPPPDDIVSICGMNESINSLQLIWTDPPVNLQQLSEQLQSNMNRYLAVSPPELYDAVDGLRTTIIAMVERLRNAGWNTNDLSVRELLQAIESQSPPFEKYVSGLSAVRIAESSLCPR